MSAILAMLGLSISPNLIGKPIVAEKRSVPTIHELSLTTNPKLTTLSLLNRKLYLVCVHIDCCSHFFQFDDEQTLFLDLAFGVPQTHVFLFFLLSLTTSTIFPSLSSLLLALSISLLFWPAISGQLRSGKLADRHPFPFFIFLFYCVALSRLDFLFEFLSPPFFLLLGLTRIWNTFRSNRLLLHVHPGKSSPDIQILKGKFITHN